MDFEVRPTAAGELDDVIRTVTACWGHHADDADVEDARILAELDRTFAAFDARGRPVGAAAAISLELTVPGSGSPAVAAGGFTDVGVLPTHRRRAVLTALVARQLDDSRARGDAVLALVAAEATIYHRFGFGVGTMAMAADIDPRRGAFLSPLSVPGELRLVGAEEAAVLLPGVYDRYRRQQPGEVSRSDRYWDVAWREAGRGRDGAEAVFHVVHEAPDGGPDGDGDVDGYAAYRVHEVWTQGLPAFVLDVEEIVSPSAAVRAALWRYLLDVDLIGTIRCWNLPVDDPLRWLLADPRALRVTTVRDMLWVRLVDVAAALSARRYAAAARVVVDVDGAGRFMLDGSPHGATCRPCPQQGPDLSISLADLGAVYLGGVRLSTLARAGRVVEHTRGALARADTLFGSDPPPHCLTDF